jgi:hypothetical protein
MTRFCRIFTVLFIFILCLASTKAQSQCTNNTQCKGTRICVNGECVNAPPQPTDMPQTQSESVNHTTDIPNIQSSPPKTKEPQESRLFLDPGIGLNLNWCRGKDCESYYGFRAGGGLGIRLSSTIAIEPNVYIDQKGYSDTYMSGGLEFSYIERDSYLSFPIAVQWCFTTKSRLPPFLSGFSPFLSGGPVIAFCLSSTFSSGDETHDIESQSSDFFFGLMIGAGSTYKAGPGSIVFNLGYTWGLTELLKDANFYQNTLSLTFGYRFEL